MANAFVIPATVPIKPANYDTLARQLRRMVKRRGWHVRKVRGMRDWWRLTMTPGKAWRESSLDYMLSYMLIDAAHIPV